MAVQNFQTDYTELDVNGRVTLTAGLCAVASIRNNEVAKVSKDFGAGHFAGANDHLFTINWTSGNSGRCVAYALSNHTGTYTEWYSTEDALGVVLYAAGPWYLWDFSDGGNDTVSVAVVPLNTDTYCTIHYAGAGVWNLKFYSDAARTNLLDTLVVTASTSFQYMFACNGYAAASGTTLTTYSMWDLDLQEAAVAGHPAIKRFGGIPFAALNRGVW